MEQLEMDTPQSLFRASQKWLGMADMARFEGKPNEEYLNYTTEAFELQKRAAMMLRDRRDAEPTRSLLFRSASSLAYRLKHWRIAEQLAAEGLAGNSHHVHARELRELLRLIDSHRHLEENKLSLETGSIQVSFDEGSHVTGARIRPVLKYKRLTALEQMIRDVIWVHNSDGRNRPKRMPQDIENRYQLTERDRSNGHCSFELELAVHDQPVLFPERKPVSAQNIIQTVFEGLYWIQNDGFNPWNPFGNTNHFALQFANRARDFLPDGKALTVLTVATKEKPLLTITKPASSVNLVAMKQNWWPGSYEKKSFLTVKGKLVVGNASTSSIIIEKQAHLEMGYELNSKITVEVERDLETVVQDLFNKDVEAEISYKEIGKDHKYKLEDIRKIE